MVCPLDLVRIVHIVHTSSSGKKAQNASENQRAVGNIPGLSFMRASGDYYMAIWIILHKNFEAIGVKST
jgi:hypothetical protein